MAATLLAVASGCGEGLDGQIDEGGGSPASQEMQTVTSALTTPSDPLFPDQWGLNNTGQVVPVDDETSITGTPGVDINVRGLWDFTQGSKGILVAVVETQDIFVDHEDLHDSVFENDNEVPDDGIDNDHNGCVDDVRGCDLRDDSGYVGPFNDDHGTHVAGIIAAGIGNGKGIVGVAPKIKILPIRAAYLRREGDPDTVVRAIKYAERMGAKIFHMSQGTFTQLNSDVEAAIAASPMLFVLSAGNDATMRYNYPSSFDAPNIISVANVDPRGELAPSSNFGPSVDIAAPGLGILSAIPSNPDDPESEYARQTGTSQAAPHVTGVAALLMNKLGLSVSQVKDRILRSGMRMTSLSGMVNSAAMLDGLAAYRDVAPFSVSATSTPTSITLTWSSQGGGARYDVERDGSIIATGLASPSFTNSGLPPGAAHIYRVRAVVNGKAGLWTHRWMKRTITTPTRVGAVGSTSYLLESPHPYPNSFGQSYALGRRNAVQLRAHVGRLELDGNRADFRDTGDYLSYAPKGIGDEVNLHGTYPAFWTDWQPGVFKFSLHSDETGQRFGFGIDAYEYLLGIPPKPIPPVLADVTPTSATLTLNFCAGSTRAELFRSTSSSGGFVRIRIVNRDLVTFADSADVTDTALASHRTFFYKMTCANDLGTSPQSDALEVVTP